MRVLSIIDSLGDGGAERVLVRLVTGLPAHDHAVIHCSRVNAVPVHGPHIRALRGAGASVVDADWRVFGDPGRRRAAMGGSLPDVVVCHWWGGTPWRAWMEEVAGAQPGAGRPWFVCVLHATGRQAPPGFDRYVILADLHRPQVPAGGRAVVIPNGVDPAVFRPSRRPRTAAGTPLRIGRPARLDDGKTPGDLVRTIDRWAIPGARWELAGDGSLRAGLEAQVATLADPSTVRLLGALPHRRIAPWLRGLDVVFHVTDTVAECHPLALLEALACGVPVVAERRGGIPAVVRHGRDGLLGDGPDEVGAHLRQLAADRGLLSRLADGARTDGRRFDVAHQLTSWRTLLAELAA